MKVALVVESMFGNTEELADAVAHGLRERGAEATVRHPGDAQDHALADVDLLVLGAPTHALSLSRPSTRADAVTQGAEPERARTGIREWLAAAGDEAGRPPVAVFDTRAKVTRHWPGSASRKVARTLRRRGFTVLDRTSFYVEGVTGPILDGELARAEAWGDALALRARHLGPPAP